MFKHHNRNIYPQGIFELNKILSMTSSLISASDSV